MSCSSSDTSTAAADVLSQMLAAQAAQQQFTFNVLQAHWNWQGQQQGRQNRKGLKQRLRMKSQKACVAGDLHNGPNTHKVWETSDSNENVAMGDMPSRREAEDESSSPRAKMTEYKDLYEKTQEDLRCKTEIIEAQQNAQVALDQKCKAEQGELQADLDRAMRHGSLMEDRAKAAEQELQALKQQLRAAHDAARQAATKAEKRICELEISVGREMGRAQTLQAEMRQAQKIAGREVANAKVARDELSVANQQRHSNAAQSTEVIEWGVSAANEQQTILSQDSERNEWSEWNLSAAWNDSWTS